MEVYFDNSATTKVLPSVADLVLKVMTEDYGNPSAKHGKGMRAEQYIKEAAEIIAGTLKVSPKEIIFTSGGSESNNMALTRTAIANKRAGNHIISTSIEHASVYNPLAYLEEQGFEVTYLPVDHNGHIRLEDLENAIREDTILVSIMYDRRGGAGGRDRKADQKEESGDSVPRRCHSGVRKVCHPAETAGYRFTLGQRP